MSSTPPWLPWKLSEDEQKELLYRHRTAVSAASASLVATIAGFPLDSVKSRLQVKRYSSVLDCVQRTFHDEGVRGFFRGVWVPLLSITFVRTASFTIFTETRNRLHKTGYTTGGPLWDKALFSFAGGVTSGAVISFGSCAFELVKVRAQLEFLISSQKGIPYKPTGTIRGAREIYKAAGFRGLYYGFPLHLARDSLGTGFYFCFYDSLRSGIDRNVPQGEPMLGFIPKAFAPFVCGCTAGIASWALVYPLDLVKTRVQQDALVVADMGGTRQTALQVFRRISKGGVAKLYRGLGVSALRSLFTHGLMWMILENVSQEIARRTGHEVVGDGAL